MITYQTIDKKEKTKSTALVVLEDGTEVIVEWWYTMLSKYGEEILNDYLLAEAYVAVDNDEAALSLMQPKATGELIIEVNEVDGEITQNVSDTRNFYQNWIDNNIV